MNCPACDSIKNRTLIPAKRLRAKADVLRCARCGTAFFEKKAWETQPDYWTAGDQESIYAEEEIHLQRNRRFQNRLRLLERYSPVGAMLDIGCGRGDFIACAANRGWSVRGLEPSATVRAVRQDLEKSIIRIAAENVSPTLGSFDVITIWDVIEHVERPAESIAKLARLLKPGGVMALETPNEEGLFKSIARLLAGAGWSGLLDFVYYLPHRVSFSAKGIRRLGERAGLSIIYRATSTTDLAFAAAKVSCHYPPGWTRSCVVALIPLVGACARISNLGNKLIVLMRKLK